MKTSTKIILTLGSVAAAGTLVYVVRSLNTRRRLTHISDEGYETAHDILYPRKYNRAKKLHYGPVLPVDNDVKEEY